MSAPDFLKAADPLGPHREVVSSIYEISTDALEQIAQWVEQRGLRTPVGSVVGYQRERLVALVAFSASQSIATGGETTLSFGATYKDDQKVFNGTTTFTLPYNGTYIVTGYTTWDVNTAGTRYVTIKQNNVPRAQDWRTAGAAGASTADATLSCVIVGVKGDLITRTAFQDTGSPLNMLNASFAIALLNVY